MIGMRSLRVSSRLAVCLLVGLVLGSVALLGEGASAQSAFASITARYEADFSQSSQRGPGLTFRRKGTPYYVEFFLDGYPASAPVRTGNRYRFDPAPGIAVEYTDLGDEVKEEITLSVRPPWNSVTFSIGWHPDLALRAEDGAYRFLDPEGDTVFAIPRPTIRDAQGRGGDISLDIANGKVTLSADPFFIRNATYPITVDPQAIGAGSLLSSGRSVVSADDRALAAYGSGVACSTDTVTCLQAGTYSAGAWSWASAGTVTGGKALDTWMASSTKAYVAGRDSAGTNAVAWEGTRSGSTWSWSSPKAVGLVASGSEVAVLTTTPSPGTTRIWLGYQDPTAPSPRSACPTPTTAEPPGPTSRSPTTAPRRGSSSALPTGPTTAACGSSTATPGWAPTALSAAGPSTRAAV